MKKLQWFAVSLFVWALIGCNAHEPVRADLRILSPSLLGADSNEEPPVMEGDMVEETMVEGAMVEGVTVEGTSSENSSVFNLGLLGLGIDLFNLDLELARVTPLSLNAMALSIEPKYWRENSYAMMVWAGPHISLRSDLCFAGGYICPGIGLAFGAKIRSLGNGDDKLFQPVAGATMTFSYEIDGRPPF